MGVRPGRLSRRQRPPARGQCPVAVAPGHASGRPRRMADRRGVRRPSPARGVRCLGHRAQGRAVGSVLSLRLPGVAPLRGGAGAGRSALRFGAGAVRAGDAVQVHRGDAAGGASDRALVEGGACDRRGRAACGAVLRGGSGHRVGGPVVLQCAGAPFTRLHGGGTSSDRGAGSVVLRRQVAVAGRSRGDLSSLGGGRRGPGGVGVRRGRSGVGGGSVVLSASDRSGPLAGGLFFAATLLPVLASWTTATCSFPSWPTVTSTWRGRV